MQVVMEYLAELALYYRLIFFLSEEALGDNYAPNKKGPNIVKDIHWRFHMKSAPKLCYLTVYGSGNINQESL